MNSVLATLIVGAFATAAAAQATDPKATTEPAASTSNTQIAKDAAANAKSPKDPSKMTTAEKEKAIKDFNKQMLMNPDCAPGPCPKPADRRFFLHVPEGAASKQSLR